MWQMSWFLRQNESQQSGPRLRKHILLFWSAPFIAKLERSRSEGGLGILNLQNQIMALQKHLLLDLLMNKERYCTIFMRQLIPVINRNGTHSWFAISQLKKTKVFAKHPVQHILSQVCQMMPTPQIEWDKVAHANFLSHLPLRWLVTGESQVLDETSIMFRDAFMTPGEDRTETDQICYTDRNRFQSDRQWHIGTLLCPYWHAGQRDTSADNKPLTKVSNGRFRKLITHIVSQPTPNRPWQNLWTSSIVTGTSRCGGWPGHAWYVD